MRNTLAIAKRQFVGYFNTPVAYIVICLVLFVLGVYFWEQFFLQQAATLRGFWPMMMLFMIIGAPALTMGLLADEKRSGTLELLLTMPVRDHELVLGKYLAVVGLWAVMLALTFTYPISIHFLGSLDWGQTLAGYLGMFLTVCGMLSFGLLASSWTSNQIVALFISAAYCVFMCMLFENFLIYFVPEGLTDLVSTISFGTHLKKMSLGVVSLHDLAFFVGMIIWPLLFTVVAIDSRRWS